jgi:hypothetical protein
VGTAVVITFSETMNTSTFSFTVAPDPGGWSPVWSPSRTVVISPSDSVVRLDHNPFTLQTTYTFTITTAQDVAGNPLAGAPYRWRFSTARGTTVDHKVYLPLVFK